MQWLLADKGKVRDFNIRRFFILILEDFKQDLISGIKIEQNYFSFIFNAT